MECVSSTVRFSLSYAYAYGFCAHFRFWLLVWTANNIGVTLINKAAFAMVDFPYPFALTAIHMAVTWAACQGIFSSLSATTPTELKSSLHHQHNNIWVRLLGDELLQPSPQSALSSKQRRHQWIIAAFSVLFTLNIAVGNASLRYVSVNFNQVMRSLVPVFTMWGSTLWFKHDISRARQWAVWPVVAGVALAVAGDHKAVSALGLLTTLACVVLASAKVVVSSELLTGPAYQMHPLRLLHRLSLPALVQCVALAVLTGEAQQLSDRWRLDLDPWTTGDWRPVLVVLTSGLWAFSLNICALQAYKLTSALTCCIAAAVKQVLMIVVGTILFQLHITRLNGLGIVVVLVASTYYSYLCLTEQKSDKPKVKDAESPLDAADVDVPTTIDHTDEEEGAIEDEAEMSPLMELPNGATERGALARR
jgi:drug/metabolite transporter (DMT)-like permease